MIAAAPETTPAAIDDRRTEERYRIYILRPDGAPHCVATTPDAQGVGLVLVTLAAEGEITTDDRVGILDATGDGDDWVHTPAEATSGTWIVNPYGRGRR